MNAHDAAEQLADMPPAARMFVLAGNVDVEVYKIVESADGDKVLLYINEDIVKKAIAEERNEIGRLAEELGWPDVAAAIRARGEK
jgi:hypothetical protein